MGDLLEAVAIAVMRGAGIEIEKLQEQELKNILVLLVWGQQLPQQ